MPAKGEERPTSAIRAREEILRLASMGFPGLCGGASVQMLHLMDALCVQDIPERKTSEESKTSEERKTPEAAPTRRRAWRLFPA